MIFKLIALLFLILTPIFSYVIFKLFGLKRLGWLFPDIAFPLYLLELYLISAKFLTHSLLPHIIAGLASLAIVIILWLVIRQQHFTYRRFIKLFWRIGFILSLIAYTSLVVFIFIAK